jgi:hypothetical protein
MSKKIIFRPVVPESYFYNSDPAPAIKKVPDWYKNISRYIGKKREVVINKNNDTVVNFTVKACMPFLDVFSSGYIISLRNDVIVSGDKNEKLVLWSHGGEEYVSKHDPRQIPEEMIPPSCSPDVFKFKNIWSVSLPKGYSALVTHPLNRHDLPFITLSGVVDLDSYHHPVNLPFLLLNDFVGTIPAGTPIAQILPFKRENWSSKIEKFDEGLTISNLG